jgi:hypothetical protein
MATNFLTLGLVALFWAKSEGLKIDRARRQRVFSGDQTGGNIDIAGRHFKGNNVVIKGGKTFVDGRDVSDYFDGNKVLEIRLSGPLENLTTTANVTCDDVLGDVISEGNVNCGDVRGDAKAGGNINAGDVSGSIKAGGNVVCG